MLDYKVGHYVTWDSIPNLKDKHTPDGLFERIKAWLVADGSKQGENLYDVSCATVMLQVVFLVLSTTNAV
jgi:hypothetical protein